MGNHAILRAHVPETCSQINQVLARVDLVLGYLQDWQNDTRPYPDDIRYLCNQLEMIKPSMEELRKANTLLRAVACEEMGRSDELQKQLDSYQKHNQDSQAEDL